MRILAGDIGGTNTRLAVYEFGAAVSGDRPKRVVEPSKFKNANHASLDAILNAFLDASAERTFTDACFGIAGPVDGRSVQVTNLPHWPVIESDAIAARLGISNPARVSLLNDMPAHASSIATIERHFPDEVTTIRRGADRPRGARAIVMPGTGLGIGGMVWDAAAGFHRSFPSEAGHEDLPARDDEQERLVRSLRKLHAAEGRGLAQRELALSGPGLRSIYACLRDPERPTLQGVPAAEQLLPLEATDPLARRTLDLFASMLGATCGNVAFSFLATGGVYLAGGIANALSRRIHSTLFTDAFERTGPKNLADLIAAVPVKLVRYEDTGLLGAATYAANVSPT